ncbi:MAG: fibronectin type III domain-containing protein, partial [Bdellovibrionales bacterium]|nr:fibronectin type III domain-containing protein [Bdellovibrionales bacterium]
TDVLNWKDVALVTSYQAVDGVDGVSIAVSNGVYYYTSVRAIDEVGLVSTPVTSGGWRFVQPADAITDLAYAGRTKSSVDLSWSSPNDNGAAITDYFVEYKETSSGTWLVFSDGVGAGTTATVTGLLASTSYDFRVRSFNGGNSPYSNVLTQETAPDDPFFDPTVFSAMNLGGATDSAIVALDDNTTINLNGSPLAGSPANAGQVLTFASAVGDVITADKPIFVAGRLIAGGSDQNQGNIVWNSPDWAGKDFITVGSRDAEHVITIYAFENTNITITEGAATHVNNDPVTAGSFATYRMPNNAGYKIASTGTITAYQYSEGTANDRVSDNLPILPPATDIIGIPSRTGQYTTIAASTSYNWYESDNTTGSGTMTEGVFVSAGGNGSQYSSPASRVIANDPIIGRSNADSDGYDSSPFIPRAFMKQRYAINHLAEWVSFASDQPATIQVFQPGGSHTTLTLSKTGNNPLSPYFGRLTAVPQGTIFESNVGFAAYYESDEAAEGSSVMEDETVLFGANGVGLPVHHKLKLWLDAKDANTLYQANDCTSIVSSDGESVGCWKDKSLHGNNATQSGANKPTWKQSVAELAGAPGVDFDGGTNYLNFAQSLVDSTEYTIFAVVHRDTTAVNNYFLGTQSAVANQGLHMGFETNTSFRLGQYGNDLNVTTPGQIDSSVALVWGKLDSTGKTVFYNGSTNTDATATQISSPGQGVIGRGFDANGFDGQVAELIVFTRALSAGEIDLMEEYLRDKWLRPTLLSNVRLWLDSSDTTKLYTDAGCSTNVTAPGNNVLCWKDKSGNGYEAKQSSGTVQWQNDGGRDVVAFSSDSLMISGATSGAVFNDATTLRQMDVFAVMRTTATGSDGFLFHHPAGNGISAKVPNGSNLAQINMDAAAGGTLTAPWGGDTATYYRWNFVSDQIGGEQAMFRDNNLLNLDGDANSVAIGTENFYIGAENGSANFQNMNLSTLLIFESKLTTAERHMIRAYLDSKN